ncbi:MAG: DUF3298 and DUF4163 domain-containing protein [Ignavibacteriaceae bacterium]|nr:DUF3298 and DUF4163 domain-containing protein [Ignavibacteriaceae bacterium]NUM69255.1 DUF3298 and DUF4163 domain-containing protein [Ignavibacteriaceae bacterium]
MKINILAFILGVLFYFNLNAQSNEFYETESGAYYFVNAKGDTAITYSYSYPVFNENNPAIDGAALNTYLSSSGLLDFAQKFEEYKGMYQDNKMDEMDWGNIWEESINIEVLAVTPGLISLSSSYYNYLGGAHGMYGTSGIQLNPETGMLYTNDQILNYDAAIYEGLRGVAESRLREKYGTGSENEMLSDLGFWFENDEFILSENFLITDTGFVFLYQPYEIAPYALGLVEIPLTFEEMEPFLSPSCPVLSIK